MALYHPINMNDVCAYGFDYMEVVLCDNDVYNKSLDDTAAIIAKLKKQFGKGFIIDTKEYCHHNLRMIRKIVDDKVEETKVYQYNCIQCFSEDQYKILLFDKKKLSPVMFPSTKCYDDILKKRKLVFRVNNKIYVNIESQTNEDDPSNTYKKVYINFNNNKDTDIKDNIKIISDILKVLTSTPIY